MNLIKIIKHIICGKKSNKQIIESWRRGGVKIGDDCEIYGTAIFGSEPYLVEIGNHVRINDRVNFVTHDGGVWVLRHMSTLPNHEKIDLFGRIKVGNNVHIGTGATIMPGVTIGNNCIIGCSSIVTKNVPDNSVVAGIPARIIEDIWEYEAKHKNDFDYTKDMSAEEKNVIFLESTICNFL